MKNWYSIKAVSDAVAELSVFDEIGFWGVQAKDFARDVKAITAPTIKLFINSPGGNVFDAITMFNALKNTGKTIEVHVLGIAASAASYLAMVGGKVVMPENTFMFLHNPISGVYGNAEDMREQADVLDKIGASLTATYAKRFKGDEKALADILAAETYLSAAECLTHGLCDEVTPAIEATAKYDADHVPEAVRAIAFKAKAPAPAPTKTVTDHIKAALAAQPDLAEFEATFAADVSLVDEATVGAALAAAVEIRAFCAMTGMADKAPEFIRARTPVADARKALNAALVGAADDTAIDTAPKAGAATAPAAKAPVTTASIWAKARNRQEQ
jgi:ATP-dependent protease ClpP protease subunit